ncbi:hypothetical protein A1F96_06272 [Pyrenophora tritici-repentis]|nr:hypothetical protein A1F96_06272 [Pyrenophora tritici-repentis]
MDSHIQSDAFMFCCNCRQTFSLVDFIMHLIKEHKKSVNLTCEQCKETFNSYKPTWIEHLAEQHNCGQNPLPCPHEKCYKNFCNLSKLKLHYRRNHTNSKKRQHGGSEDEGQKKPQAPRMNKDIDSLTKDHLLNLVAALKPIRNNPLALAAFLSTEQMGLQPVIGPFWAGLVNGRLKPLQPVGDCTSIPQLFQLTDVEPDLHLDDVWGAAISNLSHGTMYQGHMKNTPVPFKWRYVREFISRMPADKPKYVINIPLPEVSLHPPQNVAASYHLYEPEGTNVFEASANFSTLGGVVDLHDDRGVLGLSAMDDTQVKLWVLYPGLRNRAEFERESGVQQQYAQCEKSLVDGHFVVTLPGEGIVLPPGWLHATLTINPGVLFGSTLSVAEGVVDAAQILKHDMHAKSLDSFNDFKPLVQSLQAAVMAGHENQWQKALTFLCELNVKQIRKRQGDTEVKNLADTIKSLLKTKIHSPCTNCEVELWKHFPLNLSSAPPKETSKRHRPVQGQRTAGGKI